jgi:hypothetical protein
MKPLLRAWDRFWFSPIDPVSASVCRIFVGALIIFFYIADAANWQRYYAPDGVTSVSVLDPTRAHQSPWNVLAWTEGVVPVGAFWWLGLVCAVCFTLGLNTRLSTVILFVLQTSLIHANRAAANGEDLLLRMLLFYGIFAPLNETLAVDAWLQRKLRKKPRADVPLAWPIRLMQLNILLIYVLNVPYKLAVESAWWDGTAIYWTMMNRTWCRHPGWLLWAQWPVSALATYGTLLIEGSFPILVWFRRTRLYSLAAIAALHLGIAVMLQHISVFSLSMVCSFWLFVPPETTRALGAALASAGRRLLALRPAPDQQVSAPTA